LFLSSDGCLIAPARRPQPGGRPRPDTPRKKLERQMEEC
jgi:hypothetical protein